MNLIGRLRGMKIVGLGATWVAVAATTVGGCRKGASSPSGDGGGVSDLGAGGVEAGVAAAAPILEDAGPYATGIPVPLAKVEEAVNPGHLPPYAGPTGIVEGVVTMSGDAPPKAALDIPFVCGEAYATYGKAFREGTGRTVADVLVAVTGYQGYIPAAGDGVPLKIHGCSYERRTVVATYGQHLAVFNTDAKKTFLPLLEGANMPAQMAAMPGGDPVKLYPKDVGHYLLRDDANHPWMTADVFVLRYPTHAVSGLDGRFRITGVPAGKVKVSSYLPAIDVELHPDVGIAKASQEREIEVPAGGTVKVDFVLAYKTPPPRPKVHRDPNAPIVK